MKLVENIIFSYLFFRTNKIFLSILFFPYDTLLSLVFYFLLTFGIKNSCPNMHFAVIKNLYIISNLATNLAD